tara:strand:- start:17132 stop:18946 length:1815 start_codon:yes stop_codon:yes gene_type:complete
MDISKNSSEIDIIPKPQNFINKGTTLDLKKILSISLQHNSTGEKYAAKLFREFLSPINLIPILRNRAVRESILIDLVKDPKIIKDGYNIKFGGNSFIHIEASSEAGLFYAFQTFRQMCPLSLEVNQKPENTFISAYDINDFPKYKYRGMHLDVSRHFFRTNFIKNYIDMIAIHKMNVFHWHLTDDNGWRIEIKKYPKLTKKSAWRVDRTFESWKNWKPIKKNENPTYGGFYSQKEIKEIIEYADQKKITIIPEIEMPGHTSEVFASYPDLSCKGIEIPVSPGSYWPNIDIFCAGNDKVFSFLENVLKEIIQLFPGPYIHIGGDEVDRRNWKTCKKCQDRIRQEGLKNEIELQSWFIKKIEKFLQSKNKKIIGWDEIIDGGLAKSATVMSWRGYRGAEIATKAGHDVIMCPESYCYFDHYQAEPHQSPLAIGGNTTLRKVYSFNPVPKNSSPEQKRHILGAQGNLWTEYIQTEELAQYRVLPRMTALSEVLWSGPGSYPFKDFYIRLQTLQKRFKRLCWVFAPGTFSILIETKITQSGIDINLISEKPDKAIRFTLDGLNPIYKSKKFIKKFTVKHSVTIKAVLFDKKKAIGEISTKHVKFNPVP